MTPSIPPALRKLLLSASALALLAGCGKPAPGGQASAPAPLAALPPTDGPAAPGAAAPPLAALPAAPRPPVARVRRREDAYAYLDRADAYGRAFAGAPPDYAFDYQGQAPTPGAATTARRAWSNACRTAATATTISSPGRTCRSSCRIRKAGTAMRAAN